jgi:chromosome segregation ATPase
VAELETDVADKDKELKRKLQALDKGTGMAQSLHNELDKVKAKLSEAISEKDAATEAEEIQLRENEKLKVALEEAREKLDREKKRRKTVEIERTSDKDREAELAALHAKIAQLESDKEAQRLKILKIEGERDELKSKIQKLEHAAEKNEVVRAPRRACRVVRVVCRVVQ